MAPRCPICNRIKEPVDRWRFDRDSGMADLIVWHCPIHEEMPGPNHVGGSTVVKQPNSPPASFNS